MHNVVLAFLALASTAFGLGIAPNTEGLLKSADVIALVTTKATIDVPSVLETREGPIPWPATEASVAVTTTIKGTLPKSIKVRRRNRAGHVFSAAASGAAVELQRLGAHSPPIFIGSELLRIQPTTPGRFPQRGTRAIQ
jgi:hypothetical protein